VTKKSAVIFTLALIFVLVFPATASTELIEVEPIIEVGNVLALPGGVVEITYTITGNTIGFVNLDLELPYNSEFFRPISIDSSPLDQPNSFFLYNPDFSSEIMKIIFISSKEVIGDGLLFTVTYQINNDSSFGHHEFSLDVEVIKIQSGNYKDGFVNLNVQVKPGTLVIDGLGGGVSVSGRIRSYNPGNSTTIRLVNDEEGIDYRTSITDTAGYGQLEQSFAFAGVTPGTYSLVISKDVHTRFIVQKIIVGNENLDLTLDSRPEVQLMTLRCGDISGDGLINDADLTILWRAGNYNKKTDEAENSWCDLNGDGLINDADLTILWLAYNYNRGAVIIP
jgi:hypothetical protein